MLIWRFGTSHCPLWQRRPWWTNGINECWMYCSAVLSHRRQQRPTLSRHTKGDNSQLAFKGKRKKLAIHHVNLSTRIAKRGAERFIYIYTGWLLFNGLFPLPVTKRERHSSSLWQPSILLLCIPRNKQTQRVGGREKVMGTADIIKIATPSPRISPYSLNFFSFSGECVASSVLRWIISASRPHHQRDKERQLPKKGEGK